MSGMIIDTIEKFDLCKNWVDELVAKAKQCLEMEKSPGSGEFCEYCAYVNEISNN